jgi:hypothetical protein
MNDVDLLGADGGRLAMAFASGCVATFAFMATVGNFMWKVVGKSRITELEKALADEKLRCSEMETRLGDRIAQLETVLLFETVGHVRQNAQLAISELSRKISESKPENE